MFTRFTIVLALLFQVAAGLVFSPYKDVTINMDWNTNIISTSVTGTRQSVLNVLPQSGADTITWAFASGNCGSESWAGINGTALANANVPNWVAARKKYTISTGGASGTFKCTSDSDFATFINRYNSDYLVGIDFDIEGGMGQSDIDSLVQRIKNAQGAYPKLRFSFTLACFGGDANPILGTLGVMVMNSIKSYGLTGYYINLMAMDYGSAIASNCIVGSDGHCDMGKSAVNAAQSLHNQYGVPFSNIEITPMIGGNDDITETFNVNDDVDEVTTFALQNNVGAVHHWSFDRDVDCSPGYASPTCNSYGQAGVLGFTSKFASKLVGPISPVPYPVGAPTARPAVTPTAPAPAPTVPAPSTDLCAATGCHGCLWVYSTGTTCFPDYPKEACDVYADQGYKWCV